jgi:hypothetical protein
MKTLNQRRADLKTMVSPAGATATTLWLCLVAVLTATAATPPKITTQPEYATVQAGVGITFTVAATGSAPITYQWRIDGSDLPGQTNKSLIFNKAQASNEGDYVVVVITSGSRRNRSLKNEDFYRRQRREQRAWH